MNSVVPRWTEGTCDDTECDFDEDFLVTPHSFLVLSRGGAF